MINEIFGLKEALINHENKYSLNHEERESREVQYHRNRNKKRACLSLVSCQNIGTFKSKTQTVEIVNLLLHWHYSPMRAFASIMNLHQNLGLTQYFRFPNRQFFTGWCCEPHVQPPTWRTRSYIFNPWE